MPPLYDNPPLLDAGQVGDCLYNTNCGQQLSGSYPGLTYAAQQFTLAVGGTFDAICWNAIVLDQTAPLASWIITDASGVGGLPGLHLFSGLNTPVTAGVGPPGANFTTTCYSISVPPITLAPGTYYVAIQAVVPDDQEHFSDLISQGVAVTGAAESDDSGATWAHNFGFGPALTSIAVTIGGCTCESPPVATVTTQAYVIE